MVVLYPQIDTMTILTAINKDMLPKVTTVKQLSILTSASLDCITFNVSTTNKDKGTKLAATLTSLKNLPANTLFFQRIII